MKLDYILIFIISLVVVASGAFYGGDRYGTAQAKKDATSAAVTLSTSGDGPVTISGQTGTTFGASGNTGNRSFGASGGMRPTSGTVASINSSGFSVTSQDGSATNVSVTASTTMDKTTTATLSDLAVGTTVMVFGNAGSDGTIAATSVQINPLSRSQFVQRAQ